MNSKLNIGDLASVQVLRKSDLRLQGIVEGYAWILCRDPEGNIKWEGESKNLITTEGLNYIITNGLVTPALHLGLVNDTPTYAAGDTMSSHAGWTEFTAYDEANRQAWTEAGASAGVITNSASAAVFTVSTDSSVIAGSFLTTDNTKSGTTGSLIGEVNFGTGDKSADDNDTLTVTYQITLADA